MHFEGEGCAEMAQSGGNPSGLARVRGHAKTGVYLQLGIHGSAALNFRPLIVALVHSRLATCSGAPGGVEACCEHECLRLLTCASMHVTSVRTYMHACVHAITADTKFMTRLSDIKNDEHYYFTQKSFWPSRQTFPIQHKHAFAAQFHMRGKPNFTSHAKFMSIW